MAQLIRDVMTADPVRLPAESSVQEAARAMRDKDIGDIVVEQDGKLLGIITDRDIVVRVIAEGQDTVNTNIGAVCSKELVTLTADEKASEATQLMKDKAVRRVLVVDEDEPGTVVGIVSIGDIAVEKHPKSALGKVSSAVGNT